MSEMASVASDTRFENLFKIENEAFGTHDIDNPFLVSNRPYSSASAEGNAIQEILDGVPGAMLKED